MNNEFKKCNHTSRILTLNTNYYNFIYIFFRVHNCRSTDVCSPYCYRISLYLGYSLHIRNIPAFIVLRLLMTSVLLLRRSDITLSIQETFKIFRQHHITKASSHFRSLLFTVQVNQANSQRQLKVIERIAST